ncbi:acyl-CoA thioesterase II [Pseudoalteromonas sp. MMG012]|uniref:acyl-CoA thioesterase n=1 Tax=Pseudoalteromonas sp. MMG012 TaxID=2822686 RepID=UPI001B39D76F|nr:thioesterase family protein [Pseudoalteromonas sp. MMG012]MBQ4849643.1 thioesterase family protein [Pseudoalteromonas sp. MMG012]
MTFDELLSNPTLLKTPCELVFPQSWCQGRTAFGGLSAAMMLQNMKHQLPDNRRVLSMSVNFVGPLFSEHPFIIETQILRSGKNATQMLSTIKQGEKVCLVAQGCFAKERESKAIVPITQNHQLSPANSERILPYQKNVMPEFFQHVALNLQDGDMPFSGSNNSTLGGWMKFKQAPTDTLQDVHLLALADAWPPTLLQMADTPSPASSMSWYIEFVEDITLSNNAWLGFEAHTHHSANGYGLEDAKIYADDGRLLALSRQTVAIFDM